MDIIWTKKYFGRSKKCSLYMYTGNLINWITAGSLCGQQYKIITALGCTFVWCYTNIIPTTHTISWPKYTVSETYTYIIVTEAYQLSDDSTGPFQSKYCAIRSLTYGWPIIPLLIHPALNTITYLRVQLITQQRHNITIFTCN